jgi:hypothetical protein
MPYPIMFVKPTLKNEASKFLRKDINCSSLIAFVNIIIDIVLFGNSPFAVFTV